MEFNKRNKKRRIENVHKIKNNKAKKDLILDITVMKKRFMT